MKLALATTASSASAAGTEVAGGSYARQTIAMTAASSESAANTAAITFTNMPACTVTHVDIYDSNGTPRRCWWGQLSTPIPVLAGASLSFSAAQITALLQ